MLFYFIFKQQFSGTIFIVLLLLLSSIRLWLPIAPVPWPRCSRRTSPFRPAGGGRGVSDAGCAEDRDQKEGAGEEGAGPAEAHQGRGHLHGAEACREARFKEEAPPEKRDREAGIYTRTHTHREPCSSHRCRYHKCDLPSYLVNIGANDINLL